MHRTLSKTVTLFVTILVALPSLALAATDITWFGHSAYRVKTPTGKILFIDPWIKNPANKAGEADVAAIDRADLILLTHAHGDHIGNATEIAKKTGASLVTNFDLAKAMVRYAGFPAAQAGISTSGSYGGEISLLDGEVKVAFIPAVHGSGLEVPAADAKMPSDLMYGGNPGGFVITIKNGPTIYHTGDTDLFADMALVKGFGPIDIMLVCIGDRFTMGPKRAAQAVKLVNPKLAVPNHYGTFPILTGTPEAFGKEMASLKLDAKKRLKVMKVGETLVWK